MKTTPHIKRATGQRTPPPSSADREPVILANLSQKPEKIRPSHVQRAINDVNTESARAHQGRLSPAEINEIYQAEREIRQQGMAEIMYPNHPSPEPPVVAPMVKKLRRIVIKEEDLPPKHFHKQETFGDLETLFRTPREAFYDAQNFVNILAKHGIPHRVRIERAGQGGYTFAVDLDGAKRTASGLGQPPVRKVSAADPNAQDRYDLHVVGDRDTGPILERRYHPQGAFKKGVDPSAESMLSSEERGYSVSPQRTSNAAANGNGQAGKKDRMIQRELSQQAKAALKPGLQDNLRALDEPKKQTPFLSETLAWSKAEMERMKGRSAAGGMQNDGSDRGAGDFDSALGNREKSAHSKKRLLAQVPELVLSPELKAAADDTSRKERDTFKDERLQRALERIEASKGGFNRPFQDSQFGYVEAKDVWEGGYFFKRTGRTMYVLGRTKDEWLELGRDHPQLNPHIEHLFLLDPNIYPNVREDAPKNIQESIDALKEFSKRSKPMPTKARNGINIYPYNHKIHGLLFIPLPPGVFKPVKRGPDNKPVEFDLTRFNIASKYIFDEMLTNIKDPVVKELKEDNKRHRVDENGRLTNPYFDSSAPAYFKFYQNVKAYSRWDHKPLLQDKLHLMHWDEFNSKYAGHDTIFPWPWDRDREYNYDIWSNIHYGYVGRAAGFSQKNLKDAANLDDPWVGSGKDTDDDAAVKLGMRLWDTYGPNLTFQAFLEEIRKERKMLKHTRYSSTFDGNGM